MCYLTSTNTRLDFVYDSIELKTNSLVNFIATNFCFTTARIKTSLSSRVSQHDQIRCAQLKLVYNRCRADKPKEQNLIAVCCFYYL